MRHGAGGQRRRLGAVAQVIPEDGVIHRRGRQTHARTVAHETVEASPTTAVNDSVAQRRPLGRQGHPAWGDVVLLAKPAQRRRNVGPVISRGLCGDADPSVVQLTDRQADRGPARRDQFERPVQPLADLAQRASPVTLHALRQISRPLEGGNRFNEARFEKCGLVGHWDHFLRDVDGGEYPSMYTRAYWEVVNSIKGICT